MFSNKTFVDIRVIIKLNINMVYLNTVLKTAVFLKFLFRHSAHNYVAASF